MSLNRYAAKVDANQAEIVSALKSAGCTVYEVRKPVDLLVGRNGVNYLLEVKNPNGRNRIEPDQDAFFKTWGGSYAIVRSVDDALVAIGITKA